MGRRFGCLVLAGCLTLGGWAQGAEPGEIINWERIDSRYCTIWLHPSVEAKQVNRKVSTWRIRPRVRADEGKTEAGELAAKFDTIFRRAEEVLDMYPPGVHTTVKIYKHRDDIENIHSARFGYGTEAIAIYVFEENTIYLAMKELSEEVLVHEMAHCIIDHYFRIRPPRKIEELLAMHVDENLRG